MPFFLLSCGYSVPDCTGAAQYDHPIYCRRPPPHSPDFPLPHLIVTTCLYTSALLQQSSVGAFFSSKLVRSASTRGSVLHTLHFSLLAVHQWSWSWGGVNAQLSDPYSAR